MAPAMTRGCFWSTDERWEETLWCVLTGKAGFDGTRAIVDYDRLVGQDIVELVGWHDGSGILE